MASVTFPGIGSALGAGLIPGALVRHPAEPDWGVGQVQSAIGERVTVNFEHVGKRLINTAKVPLELVRHREEGR